MLDYDEKRNYIRMEIDSEVTYRLANSAELYRGHCSSISGAGVSFTASQAFEAGKAMEINVIPKNTITPPMTAFIEVVRSTPKDDGTYEIAGAIKSIKGN